MDDAEHKPLVSVVMATYNRAGIIRRAIESVLNQSFADFELIIVDDGSADATHDVVASVRDPRLVYVKNEPNWGFQKSLNRGLRLARGKYVARIDDDDAWSDTGKLEQQVSFLESHPGSVLVGTGVIVVNEAGKELYRFLNPETDEDIRDMLLLRNCFAHSSVMFEREAALLFGGYDESSPVLEDYKLWLQLGTVGKIANLPRYGVSYGASSMSMSRTKQREMLRKTLPLIRAFRSSYPHYARAYLAHSMRLVVYGYMKLDHSNGIVGGVKRLLLR